MKAKPKIVHVEDEEDNYTVGYGKPPKSTRFKKGQSGNPSGRPIRRLRHRYENDEAPLRRFLLEEITVTVKGKKVRMLVVDALVKGAINRALGGCHRTLKFLIQESGGLKALREEDKQQISSADLKYLEKVKQDAEEWLSKGIPAKAAR